MMMQRACNANYHRRGTKAIQPQDGKRAIVRIEWCTSASYPLETASKQNAHGKDSVVAVPVMLTPSSNLPADSMPISRVSSPRADGYRASTVIRNSSLRSTGVTIAANSSISPAAAQRTSWARRSSQRPLPHSLGFHHRIRQVRPVLSRPSRASGRDSHPKPPPATVIIGSWETIASSMPSVPVA